MHVNQRFLTEERGARGRGIPRGSVGAHNDTAICGGSTLGARAPVREISAYEAAERAAYLDYRVRDESRIAGFVRGSELSEPALNRERVRQRIGDDFARWQGERSERFDMMRPPKQHTGPVKERAPKSERRAIVKARAAEKQREESEYSAMVRKAREGLDMSNPKHRARFEARMARMEETASVKNSLNHYAALTRECGGTATV